MDFGFYGMQIRPPVPELCQFDYSLPGSRRVAGGFSADEKLKKSKFLIEFKSIGQVRLGYAWVRGQNNGFLLDFERP